MFEEHNPDLPQYKIMWEARVILQPALMQRILVQNPGKIPQELVDIVLGFLNDDIPTLLICATVCRTWVNTTQFYIFSHIALRRDDSRKQQAGSQVHHLDAFCRLVQDNTHLAPFMQTIHLRSRGPALLANSRKVDTWWQPLKDTLGPLLTRLTRLIRIEVLYERVYGWDALMAWEGTRTVARLATRICTLDLRKVTFEDIGSFLRLLNTFSVLDEMFLQGIAFIESQLPLDFHHPLPLPLPSATLPLKSLSIHGIPRHTYELLVSAFLHPQSPADIRFIRQLKLHWYHTTEVLSDVSDTARFLTSNQGRLEHLSTCESFGPEHLRPLLQLGCLKSLQLTALPNASAWLDRMQSTFTEIPLHSLRSLTVHASGQYSKFCLQLDSAKWAALDKLLAHVGLGNFTILILRTQTQYQNYWDLEWAEPDDFRSTLPIMHMINALNIELEVLDM